MELATHEKAGTGDRAEPNDLVLGKTVAKCMLHVGTQGVDTSGVSCGSLLQGNCCTALCYGNCLRAKASSTAACKP
eukprot:5709085-Amphidinium_carterae.1